MKRQIVMLKLNNSFSKKYRIYYEDTDAGGVVYYANYLKFFERARTDFLRELNISQSYLLQNEKTAFVVRSCSVEYIKPAILDDLIEISVVIKNISSASIEMWQEAKKDNILLASLLVKIISINSENFKPKRMPDNIKSVLKIG